MKLEKLFILCLAISSIGISLVNGTDIDQNTQLSTIENVNIDIVKQEWTKRHNQERKKYGLDGYILNQDFNISAKTRSDKLSKSGKLRNLHQRSTKDGYYSYGNIKSWFQNLGVDFEDVNGTLFTESIGRGYYKCNKTDCTQDLIKSIKSTFKFFMSEKGRSRKPHYNGIVSSNFSNMGVGISIDKKTNRYFLVSHYGVNTINTK
ncbi:MAG: CAP domain-containing protein [Candidatus Absconditicoccaceae bacterium]